MTTTARATAVTLLAAVAFALAAYADGGGGDDSDAAAMENRLIISYADRLEVMDGLSTAETFSLSPVVNYIIGVTIGGRGQIFVSDMNRNGTASIYSVSLDSHHEIKPIIKTGSSGLVEGVAFDPERELLFFSGSANRSSAAIFRSSLGAATQRNTSHSVPFPADSEILVSFDEKTTAKSISFDRCSKRLYWMTWQESGRFAVLESAAAIDGSDRKVLVGSGLSRPHGLVVDAWARRLVWIDVDGDEYRIESSRMDGSERRVICSGRHSTPFALAVDSRHVFWSDWANSAVWRVPKSAAASVDGECARAPVLRLGTTRPMGLAALAAAPRDACAPPPPPRGDATTGGEDDAAAGKLAHAGKSNDSVVGASATFSGGGGPCDGYCVHGACSLTSLDIPVCACERGFAGNRCHNHVCHNYCLHESVCRVSDGVVGGAECECAAGFVGRRCETRTYAGGFTLVSGCDGAAAAGNAHVYLAAWIATLVMLVATAAIVAAIVCKRRKIDGQARKDAAGEKQISGGGGGRDLKRQRTFSSGRGGGGEGGGGGMSNGGVVGGCAVAGSCHGGGGADDGVVIDLEDCCQMTICQTPCVEATFRKPTTHRKHRVSISRGETDNDKEQLLLDNDVFVQ